jgi:hypothetical protein
VLQAYTQLLGRAPARKVAGDLFMATLIGVRFIVFPNALRQGFTGDDPKMKFYQRILDYALVTTYSVFTVLWFDAIVECLRAGCGRRRG